MITMEDDILLQQKQQQQTELKWAQKGGIKTIHFVIYLISPAHITHISRYIKFFSLCFMFAWESHEAATTNIEIGSDFTIRVCICCSAICFLALYLFLQLSCVCFSFWLAFFFEMGLIQLLRLFRFDLFDCIDNIWITWHFLRSNSSQLSKMQW